MTIKLNRRKGVFYMSFRDDFYKTINHKKPNHVIIDFGGNPLSSMEGKSMLYLLEYLGYDTDKKELSPFGATQRIDERILKHFNIPTRSVGKILAPQKSMKRIINDTEYTDEWGIRRKFTGLYWDIVDYPLKDSTLQDLDTYSWPDPDSLDMEEIELFKKQAEYLYNETEYVVCGEHPVYGIFELGCWMCGFEDFMIKMAIEPEYIHKFFTIVLNYQKKVIEKYYGAIGKYIHYTSSGDDFATQTNTFVSKDMFREFIAPYFKERIRYTKEFTQAKYLHHSCGNIFTIIDDLINCGVDILNPIQPVSDTMSANCLKKTFGEKITFHGGIDTQALLPFGTKDEIEHAVKETIEIMSENGGYIFASAHNIQEDVPPENLVYLLEAANKYGNFTK